MMKWTYGLFRDMVSLLRIDKAKVAPLVFVLFLFPAQVRADAMREFVLSCSYGVLAGTLVGTATLAFSDKPGDNLQKVARGASIGLYAGILLGVYVVYGVPSDGEPEPLEPYPEGYPGVQGRPSTDWGRVSASKGGFPPAATDGFHLLPLLSAERGWEGAVARLTVWKF